MDKALGNNLGATFKTFDNFKDGVATSVKSVDLNVKSYQDGMKLFYKLNKDLRAINNFTEHRLGTVLIKKSDINSNVLKLIINNQLLTQQQIKNIERLVDNANKMNIKVEGTILK
ncbi:hypothetical protein [Fusobacterium russii]|uniref:endonuclease toxin domain-containing protein n=1 Tax=Fusobacterium russii TaxID=854 RepID=UPI00316AE8FC